MSTVFGLLPCAGAVTVSVPACLSKVAATGFPSQLTVLPLVNGGASVVEIVTWLVPATWAGVTTVRPVLFLKVDASGWPFHVTWLCALNGGPPAELRVTV